MLIFLLSINKVKSSWTHRRGRLKTCWICGEKQLNVQCVFLLKETFWSCWQAALRFCSSAAQSEDLSVQSRHRKTSKFTVNWGWGKRAESKMTEIWINRYATRRGEIAHMPLKWERPLGVNVWGFTVSKFFSLSFLFFFSFSFFVQENLMPGHMTLKPKLSVFKFLIRLIAFAKKKACTHKFCGEACRTLFCLQRSLTFYRAGLKTNWCHF